MDLSKDDGTLVVGLPYYDNTSALMFLIKLISITYFIFFN